MMIISISKSILTCFVAEIHPSPTWRHSNEWTDRHWNDIIQQIQSDQWKIYASDLQPMANSDVQHSMNYISLFLFVCNCLLRVWSECRIQHNLICIDKHLQLMEQSHMILEDQVNRITRCWTILNSWNRNHRKSVRNLAAVIYWCLQVMDLSSINT